MILKWGRNSPHPEIPLIKSWNTTGTDATEIDRIGVYSIKNKINKKVLVGRTSNLQRRYDVINYLLEHDKFGKISPKMQIEYNHYGASNFEFIVHEICPSLKLSINRYDHWRAFNIRILGGEVKLYDIQNIIISELKNDLREGEVIGG